MLKPKYHVRLNWLICIFGLIAYLPLASAEDGVEFPWGCPPVNDSSMRARRVYQTLGQSKHPHHDQHSAPVQELPTKTSYAYGWFGSNPTPQWGRHFGYSRNFTQWTAR